MRREAALAQSSGKSVDYTNDVIDKMAKDSFTRGYFCAVALLLREEGCVSSEVRSLFNQGGSPLKADAADLALFAEHGLI